MGQGVGDDFAWVILVHPGFAAPVLVSVEEALQLFGTHLGEYDGLAEMLRGLGALAVNGTGDPEVVALRLQPPRIGDDVFAAAGAAFGLRGCRRKAVLWV